MSVERWGLLIGMIAAVMMTAESIVWRFERVEKLLEDPLTFPARPTRVFRWVRTWRELVALGFFTVGYLLLFWSLDVNDPAVVPAFRFALVGIPLAYLSLVFDWLRAKKHLSPFDWWRFASFWCKVFAAILLAPFWITSGIVGLGVFVVLLGLYFLAFPLFLMIRIAYWAKRKHVIRGVFTTLGFLLLTVSFLIQYVVTP